MKDKKPCKVRDHCHYTDKNRGAAHSICNLKYRVSKRIPIVFHNGSNYDYYLIIKELAEVIIKIYTNKTDLLEDLTMSLLNFNFVVIYLTHKI